jgi:hypothetical protein
MTRNPKPGASAAARAAFDARTTPEALAAREAALHAPRLPEPAEPLTPETLAAVHAELGLHPGAAFVPPAATNNHKPDAPTPPPTDPNDPALTPPEPPTGLELLRAAGAVSLAMDELTDAIRFSLGHHDIVGRLAQSNETLAATLAEMTRRINGQPPLLRTVPSWSSLRKPLRAKGPDAYWPGGDDQPVAVPD